MGLTLLKYACAVSAGVALGLGIGRGVWSGEGASASGERERTVVNDAVREPGDAGGRNDVSGAEAVRDGCEQENAAARRKRLVERLLRGNYGEDDLTEHVERMTALATLAAGEIGPVMELLVEKERDGAQEAGEPLLFLLARRAVLEPDAALEFLRRNPGRIDKSPQVMGAIISELANRDLAAAKATVASLEDRDREAGEKAITRRLRERDPAEALAFARERGNGEAERETLRELALADPLAAAAMAGADGTRVEMVAGTASDLLEMSPKTFKTWAAALANPAQRGAALRERFQAYAHTIPRGIAMEAADWIARDPVAVAASGGEGLLGPLVANWLSGERKAIPEAAAWATGLPAGEGRDGAVGAAGRAWVEQDAAAASAWVSSLPYGAGRDEAAMALVRKICGETPEDALAWARTIESAKHRGEALRTAVENLARRDESAAAAAVETLPEADRAALREMVRAARESKAAGP